MNSGRVLIFVQGEEIGLQSSCETRDTAGFFNVDKTDFSRKLLFTLDIGNLMPGFVLLKLFLLIFPLYEHVFH